MVHCCGACCDRKELPGGHHLHMDPDSSDAVGSEIATFLRSHELWLGGSAKL